MLPAALDSILEKLSLRDKGTDRIPRSLRSGDSTNSAAGRMHHDFTSLPPLKESVIFELEDASLSSFSKPKQAASSGKPVHAAPESVEQGAYLCPLLSALRWVLSYHTDISHSSCLFNAHNSARPFP